MSVVFTASTRSPIRSLPDHKRVEAIMVVRTTMVFINMMIFIPIISAAKMLFLESIQ